MTIPVGDRWVDMAGERYTARVDMIVASLRKMADAVERYREPDPNLRQFGDGDIDFPNAAYSVIHEVTWGVANLGLDQLARVATDADRALCELAHAPKEQT